MSKMLKVLLPVLLVVALVLSAACSARKGIAPSPPYPAPAPMAPSAAERSYSAEDSAAGGQTAGSETERRIVRTGYLTLEVKNIADSMVAVSNLAKELGGYVVSSNKQGGDGAVTGRVAIRVPVERFDEALDKLRKLAVDVPYESTEGRDVTEEYSDLKAQLRNLEATEAQYLELLKKADKVEDILKVQRELSSVRGQIERVKGRIQYLERTSDMALIEVTLQQTKPLGETGWSALKTLKSAARGLITFGKVLADALIWIAIFSPIWVPIVVLVWYFRKRRKAKIG
ncbi:MAG: DUF4349 domain-containing protein [Chloroflexi bacterium]|nr:DUF4349 domain-containing protein [Chloroflexota bacterium]MBM3182911.1 DUF4349 domain-containing protein [Chloroflexota bacterium]